MQGNCCKSAALDSEYGNVDAEFDEMAPPTTEEEYRSVELQMDAYNAALDSVKHDVRREYARIRKFVLESVYPDLQPDRESDWHCKDGCEIVDCTTQTWTMFDRRRRSSSVMMVMLGTV